MTASHNHYTLSRASNQGRLPRTSLVPATYEAGSKHCRVKRIVARGVDVKIPQNRRFSHLDDSLNSASIFACSCNVSCILTPAQLVSHPNHGLAARAIIQGRVIVLLSQI